jgi:hypothetical protein
MLLSVSSSIFALVTHVLELGRNLWNDLADKERVGERGNAYNILIPKPEEKDHLARPKH